MIRYVAEQCASAAGVRLEEEQLLRAADRCVQLGSPTAAFELCLMDRTGAATDAKAREVARLLGEDAASDVAAALARTLRTVHSKIVGFKISITMLDRFQAESGSQNGIKKCQSMIFESS